MYSVIMTNGNVCDIYYNKLNEHCYNIMLNEKCLGQAFNLERSWAAVTFNKDVPAKLRSVKGFKSRLDCVEWVVGTWREENGRVDL